MVCTLLSEGWCGDVAGKVRPDFWMGLLLSSEERREVLGRLEGEGGVSPRRSGGNAGRGGVLLPATGAPWPAAR